MDITIRAMQNEDKTAVKNMMRDFYSSDAVSTDGSNKIFDNDIDECLSSSPYLVGYVFTFDGNVCGYAMLAKSFSTEFGKTCVWLEDLYILPSFRGKGIGSKFLDFMSKQFGSSLLRLEAEPYNENALKTYEKQGFSRLPYLELVKNCKE